MVEESLRDAERGKAASVPSRRCTAIWTAARLAPSGLMARLAARGGERGSPRGVPVGRRSPTRRSEAMSAPGTAEDGEAIPERLPMGR